MSRSSKSVLIYRWGVFLLAAGYSVYMIATGDYGPPDVGGPFRFLTIWALLISFYSASRMLALSQGRISRRHEVTASVAAVLNGMVVFLYWKLFFTDPALVSTGDRVLLLEYYLHLTGPLLQWIDALFLLRAFRRPLPAIGLLVIIICAYVGWTEVVIGPISDSPVGTVTSGLPYPFLNSMEWAARVTFYAVNMGVAIGLYFALFALAWIIRRALPRGRP